MMKNRAINIFWSVVMIGAGVVFFLRATGVVDFEQFSDSVWTAVFSVLSVFFFLTYFVRGVENWGWLFPAAILGAVALTIGLDDTALGRILSGAPILASIAIPFIVAFAMDPQNRRWALIPAWVMAALTLVVLFEERVNGNLVGTFILYSIGLPFLAVYLMDRTKKWALIPFAALCVVGLIPLLESFVDDRVMVVVIMGLFAAPFFAVYFWAKKNWWALIPAGVFASVGLGMGMDYILNPGGAAVNEPAISGAILAGMGLTFGALWLRRGEQPTDWAKYPAAGLMALAVLAFAFEQNLDFFWPVILIAAGAGVLVWGLLKKPAEKVK